MRKKTLVRSQKNVGEIARFQYFGGKATKIGTETKRCGETGSRQRIYITCLCPILKEARTHTNTSTHTHTHKFIYVYMSMHTCIYVYICLQTHTHTHICIYIYLCIYHCMCSIIQIFHVYIYYCAESIWRQRFGLNQRTGRMRKRKTKYAGLLFKHTQ